MTPLNCPHRDTLLGRGYDLELQRSVFKRKGGESHESTCRGR